MPNSLYKNSGIMIITAMLPLALGLGAVFQTRSYYLALASLQLAM